MEDSFFPGSYARKAVTRFLITRTRLRAFSYSTRPPRFAGEWNHAMAGKPCKRFFAIFDRTPAEGSNGITNGSRSFAKLRRANGTLAHLLKNRFGPIVDRLAIDFFQHAIFSAEEESWGDIVDGIVIDIGTINESDHSGALSD